MRGPSSYVKTSYLSYCTLNYHSISLSSILCCMFHTKRYYIQAFRVICYIPYITAEKVYVSMIVYIYMYVYMYMYMYVYVYMYMYMYM